MTIEANIPDRVWHTNYPAIAVALTAINDGNPPDSSYYKVPVDQNAQVNELESLLNAKSIGELLAYVKGDGSGERDAGVPAGFERIHKLMKEFDLLEPGRQG
jgi:hypothetical protein